MHPFYSSPPPPPPQQQQQQQLSPWYYQSYIPHSLVPFQAFNNSLYSLPYHSFINPCCSNLNKDLKTISDSELLTLLNDRTKELKRLYDQDQQQQLPVLIDLLSILNRVHKSVLVATAQNDFFSLIRTPISDIMHRWLQFSFLWDNESAMFHITAKLIRRLIKAVDDVKLIPLWLSDSTLLEPIANCLTNIASSQTFLEDKNKYHFKYFSRLIDAYTIYQQRLSLHTSANRDILLPFLEPTLHCLTSSHFIATFTNLQPDMLSMTTAQKFFLLKCPALFTSYYGSRLEQTMDELLSTMLPHYVSILDKFLPSLKNWERPMIRSIQQLFKIINHGANQFTTNAQHISHHLSLIDHLLKLINEPIIYDNLRGSLSNSETILMNTVITLLVNMLNEPTVLAHIKQSHVASVFLRLTSCKYEPLVFNVYTLLAYTTHEEDLKTMENSDRLLVTIIQSLKKALDEKPERSTQIEQLLETLKGLVQHDQIKDEIVKQNLLPFLLECTKNLTEKAHILIFEILWSLAFREEGALALRTNNTFLEQIQAISKESKNEQLKKAADGLVWKLIREPAFLEKVARQEEDEQMAVAEVMETVVEEVVNINGQKEFITTVKPATDASGERIFQYDIMISYCHADKELTYKIHKFLLDQGFKVWIDLDNMYGPAMSAMADAVENSEFVIMCMSDAYKQSTYCQAEAEYAFKCKRRLIPLIMRKGYKPDGWLGFMIGSRMYIDYGRYDFDIACEKIINEISLQSKRPLPSRLDSVDQHENPVEINFNQQQQQQPQQKPLFSSLREKHTETSHTNVFSAYKRRKPLSNFARKFLNQWTESDVLDFLYTERLIPMMALCETMNGRALVQLYRMCISRSSRTYILLNNELTSTYKMKLPIGIYTRFLGAMEQRINTRPLPPPRIALEHSQTTIAAVPQKYNLSVSKTLIARYNVPQKPPYPNGPYDAVFTSNAPALDVLRAVERYGLNFTKMLSK